MALNTVQPYNQLVTEIQTWTTEDSARNSDELADRFTFNKIFSVAFKILKNKKKTVWQMEFCK